MAILGSIRRARVECFSYQCKRWYSHIYGINFMNDAVGGRRVQILGHGRTSEQFSATRSFAAPVQAKPKVEAKHTGGPRLNKAITSEFVRLVIDEGHSVVSRREALDRAMRLKLDLVEVDRNAKPPVCKIMDFHKEMYKQQLKEKDRLKGKSALTLRKGDCKEVRFTGKTEQKDLQMKADMVKRQMDRGYRVKCMAMGTEEEDLGGLLSRLFALIEDVAFVESGPRVEKRQAYVVVRHSKFGSTKKSPAKKVAKIVEAPSSEVKAAATSLPLFTSTDPAQIPLQVEEEWEHTESGSEMEEILSDEEADALYSSETPITTPIEEPEEASGEKMEWSAVDASDDFEKVFGFDGDSSRTTSRSTVNRSLGSVDAFSLKEDTADIAELLPKKLPITSVVRGPDLSFADQRGQINKSGIVKNDLQEPKIHSPNPRWQPQPAVNAAPSTTQNPKSADNSWLRNLKPPSLDESRIHSLNPRWQPQPAVKAAPSTTQNPKSADNSLLRNLKPPSLDESRIHSLNPRWPPAVNAAPSTAQNPKSADNSPLRNLEPPSLDESRIHSPNPRWQPQPAVNAAPSTAQNPKSADNSPLRNLKPPSLDESRIHSPNPRWQPQPAVNAAPSTAQNPKSADNSPLRNLKPPSLDESRIHSPNPRWQPQPAVNAAPSTAQNPKSADNSPLRNLKPPSLYESKKQPQVDTKQGPSISSYGIFSAPKTAAPSFQKTSTEGNSSKERNTMDPVKSPGSNSVSSNANPLKPAADSPRQDADKTKQRGWGIFSGETSGPNQHRNPESQMKEQR